ncbi:MAG: 2-amino-4-hydroxy-6-hydroxymethyldihydropteridine diphosphokinase [Oscillospiraceae bacterium]|jgi:2-amino-4-hydroxy-6-hydroxymethyldihydropteridine diphosphokinase|nr:2-amino-4-hydroxy-6-hydroxymethyldihydropteridine diphosphokinase [Oscillospiraceae bacterium]
MSEAVVGLGSNLGERDAQLLQAVQALSRLPGLRIMGISSIYASAPETDAPDQSGGDAYHNMVVKVETEVSPAALLGACLGIEAAMGRMRRQRNEPRCIDLDLLLYEGVKNESYELTLPHPRMLRRAFVLLPLKELYPAGRAPGIFFEPYLKELQLTGVQKLDQRITME